MQGPELVEASADKLEQLRRLRAELAEMERKIAAKAPPRPRPWHEQARPEQLPPPGEWDIWLYLAGRGCIAGDTLIYLPVEDRHVPVAELAKAGRPITVLSLTPDGPMSVETPRAPFVKGRDELFEVVFTDGSRVTVTAAHRFLTERGWLPLAAINVGMPAVAAGAPAVPVPAGGPQSAQSAGRWSWGAHRLRGTSPEQTPLVEAPGVEWALIRSVTSMGWDVFYDLHVPGWNNYAANGLWHHNSGKTRSGAEWVIEQAARQPDSEWAVIAPTWRDCQKVCFEGRSGLIKAMLPGEFDSMNLSALQLRMTNGAKIYGYSADKPDRLRGANLSGAWVDELASMQHADDLLGEALLPALRIGEHPRILVTTTPRPVKVIKELVARTDGSVVVVRGSTFDNIANLSKTALDSLRARYEGTRMGRQELEAEILEDVEGALWSRDGLDASRVDGAPHLVRIVVAVDPAVTSGEKSDFTGIVVAGKSADGHLYVLEDLTMKGSPHACMVAAVNAYKKWEADRIVGEVNNGGDYIGELLRTVDPNVPYTKVRASRGKTVRAEPIASLWEQGRGHIVGVLPELEDQMCIAGGSLISTSRGPVPIEQVNVGDHVWTRAGWRPVIRSGWTGFRSTITLETAKGSVQCTPDHPVFVVGRGFVPAEEVQTGCKLLACPGDQSANSSSSTANATTATTTTISRQVGAVVGASCTETSGHPSTVLSPPSGMSTTETRTVSTTTRPTWSHSAELRTSRSTGARGRGPDPQKSVGRPPRPGGQTVNLEATSAPTAAPSICREPPGQPSSVRRFAETVTGVRNSGQVDVYDLTVDGQPEFFANGLLVHNCSFSIDGSTGEHDDRVDALTWAATELQVGASAMVYLAAISRVCPSCDMPNRKVDQSCRGCGGALAA